MLLEYSKYNLYQKAMSQPEKVRQVLNKIRTDGLIPTLETVFKRLGEPLPLGYCNAGVVVEVGAGVQDLKPGDRVASNGAHAEFVCVPQNLCAKIPETVTDESAAFTVLSSISLQGIRLMAPSLGERIVVFGAGLIGLVTTQLLRACGCRVLALDLNDRRLALAKQYGADIVNTSNSDPIAVASAWTEGSGVDGVIITASAKTDAIVHQAAVMCRKRGRIVLVGVVGLNLSRADFYEKELTFQVSCSYGPGRYDEKYEQVGWDYPVGYVRWTEQRNFAAVLDAMALGSLKVSELITDRIPQGEAERAYAKITSDSSCLGVVLEYPSSVELIRTISVRESSPSAVGQCVAMMIGAGNYAKMTMAPALAKSGARLKYVSDTVNAPATRHIASKYGFENATSDTEAALADTEVNTVFIATGHNSHAALVQMGLKAGKHVFVEKPLALCREDVNALIVTAKEHLNQQVTLGFNRRFSVHTQKIRQLLAGRSEPLTMTFTCNAGLIPAEAWVHDPERGGGLIIGEACHFMDLLSFIAGSPIVSVAAFQVGGGVAVKDDKVAIVLRFADGSVGNVNYFGNGHKAYPKEMLEVFSEGRILRLNNFRVLQGWGFKGFSKLKTRLDKGHLAEFKAFVKSLKEVREPLIPLCDAVNVTLASFAAVQSVRDGKMVDIDDMACEHD